MIVKIRKWTVDSNANALGVGVVMEGEAEVVMEGEAEVVMEADFCLVSRSQPNSFRIKIGLGLEKLD